MRTPQVPLSIACDVWALRVGAGTGYITRFELEEGAKDPVTDTIAAMLALATYDQQRDRYVFDAGSHFVYAHQHFEVDAYFVYVKPKAPPNA